MSFTANLSNLPPGVTDNDIERQQGHPSECEIARVLNQFTKGADANECQRYRRTFAKMSGPQKRRLAENILAGDDLEMAIRDAKESV